MDPGRLARRLKSAALAQLVRLGWATPPPAPEEVRHLGVSHDPSIPLPRGAAEALRPDHPRLLELRRQYAELRLPVSGQTFWAPETVARDVRLPWFRGDNAYVWQYRQLGSGARAKMRLITDYVAARDGLKLLGRLQEDGLFGCWTFPDPRFGRVSRDLLDSVNELNFLERQLGVAGRPGLRIADIGAGYGRLAHRACAALPNIERYDCFDAVPESTFLCEYYLAFRGLADTARAVPLGEAAHALGAGRYDLAVNIHSFSECTHDGVRWWLERLRTARVPHLLIVPNHYDLLLSAETDGSQRDYGPLLAEAGYELVHKELVLDDATVQPRVGVRDFFMLYRLAA